MPYSSDRAESHSRRCEAGAGEQRDVLAGPFEILGDATSPLGSRARPSAANRTRRPVGAILIAGAVAVVVVEWLILRWVAKRDRMFPPISLGHVSRLLGSITSTAGAAQLLAADRYVRLRRSVYFAGWRTMRAGGAPGVTDVDVAEMATLLARAGALPHTTAPPCEPSAAEQPAAEAPPPS